MQPEEREELKRAARCRQALLAYTLNLEFRQMGLSQRYQGNLADVHAGFDYIMSDIQEAWARLAEPEKVARPKVRKPVRPKTRKAVRRRQ